MTPTVSDRAGHLAWGLGVAVAVAGIFWLLNFSMSSMEFALLWMLQAQGFRLMDAEQRIA